MDLPGDMHGAPTVQVAQAFQKECRADVSGPERFKIGSTGKVMIIDKDQAGKPAYSIEENGQTKPLKIAGILPADTVSVVMFIDNSSLTTIHMQAPAGKVNPAPTYKDATGKHKLTPETVPDFNKPALKSGGPACAS